MLAVIFCFIEIMKRVKSFVYAPAVPQPVEELHSLPPPTESPKEIPQSAARTIVVVESDQNEESDEPTFKPKNFSFYQKNTLAF